MFSSLETIAIIAIIIAQFVLAYHAFKQIRQTKSFLPGGRASLTLKEYEIPSDIILELEPSDVIGKIKYRTNIDFQEDGSVKQPRDEYGRFTSKDIDSFVDDIEELDID